MTSEPERIREVPKTVPTLTDQWGMLENIERELRDRIRREHGSILAEHDRRWVDIQNDYRQRISEEVAGLEKQRDVELKELTDQTALKLREHELLAKRRLK